MRIAVVNPNSSPSMTEAIIDHARSSARPDTVLLGVTSTGSVASVESHRDEVRASVAVLTEVDRLEAGPDLGRPDAYVIACFGDTGLPGARESARGPVVGMTEAALQAASLLAHRFTIITMPVRTREMSDRVVRSLGLEHRCTVRAVDEPVSALTTGSLHLLPLFLAEAQDALRFDAAELIILGCAGLADLADPLSRELGVPVVEGVAAAVSIAEGLVAQRLTTSRQSTWADGRAAQ